MRTRRRRKYTWFPQLGFQGAQPENDTTVLPITPAVVPGSGALSDVVIFPIVPDTPKDTPTAGTENLDDFIGNEYLLKRIVGRVWFAAGFNDSTAPNVILDIAVGIGFFVARADRTAAAGASPIGTATAVERKENYGPLTLQNTREPWIWRRVWLVSNSTIVAATNAIVPGNYPRNNLDGSVAEGSHIDAKTARRVGDDDRLFCAIQTVATLVSGNPGDLQLQDFTMDVRVLGALRKARGKSAF